MLKVLIHLDPKGNNYKELYEELKAKYSKIDKSEFILILYFNVLDYDDFFKYYEKMWKGRFQISGMNLIDDDHTLARTNNYCESQNARITTKVGMKHPRNKLFNQVKNIIKLKN